MSLIIDVLPISCSNKKLSLFQAVWTCPLHMWRERVFSWRWRTLHSLLAGEFVRFTILIWFCDTQNQCYLERNWWPCQCKMKSLEISSPTPPTINTVYILYILSQKVIWYLLSWSHHSALNKCCILAYFSEQWKLIDDSDSVSVETKH